MKTVRVVAAVIKAINENSHSFFLNLFCSGSYFDKQIQDGVCLIYVVKS